MSNTRFMTTHPNGIAPIRTKGPNPSGSFRMGAKGGRMAQAWQYIWDRLSAVDFKPASALAQEAAQAFDLKPVSVTEMLCRMRSTGVLEQSMIPVKTTYQRGSGKPYTAMRPSVHYRIATRDGAPDEVRIGAGRA